MTKLVKPANRALFVACVVLTGALAGAFVWAFFFLMDAGLGFLWNDGRLALSSWLNSVAPELSRGPFGVALFPFLICMLGGVVIGLYEKKTGIAAEDLPDVMAKVKSTGRYEYDHLGKLSIAALLPLLFGGSVGPGSGLDRGDCRLVHLGWRPHEAFWLRFSAELTILGCQAALAALFTAPLYGFAAPLSSEGKRDDGGSDTMAIEVPKAQKAFVYACAIVGALGAFLGLGSLFGGGMGMPRFEAAVVGGAELAWFIPLAAAGVACGWAFRASDKASAAASRAMGDRP